MGIRKGFTLTELLIALGVIGILVAILLPVIFSILPDQNALMAKRAYYSMQTVISDLLNDEGCYPDKSQAIGDEKRVGLDDGYGYPNCNKWGTEYINTENAAKKFATLFANKLDIKDNFVINDSGTASFRTKDGMNWVIYPSSDSNASKYSNSVQDFFAVIKVDVNGNDKPDCGQSESVTDACKEELQSGFDQFAVAIGADGKMVILDGWARDAVKVSKDITGNAKDEYFETTVQPGDTTIEGGTKDPNTQVDTDGYDDYWNDDEWNSNGGDSGNNNSGNDGYDGYDGYVDSSNPSNGNPGNDGYDGYDGY